MTEHTATPVPNRTHALAMRDWMRTLPPKWLFRIGSRLGLTPPPIKALMDASAFMLPQWMYAAAKLNIPDALAGGPKTSAELSRMCGVDEERLSRLLYSLEQRGYFRRVRGGLRHRLDGPWAHTARSETLIADHPNTVRPILFHWVEDCYGPAAHLLDALQRNTCAFSLTQSQPGIGFFEHFLPAHPEKARQFSEAMTASSAFSDEAVLRDVDWSRFSTMVDAGGSNGSFLELALRRFPAMRGVLFDRPNVIAQAEQAWDGRDPRLRQRIDFVPGDFFGDEGLPTGGESGVVVLRNVLHDWGDAECLRILGNVRRSMHDTGRVVLIEVGLGIEPSKHILEQARSGLDMLMLTMFEGKERTHEQLTELLAAAGFGVVAVTSTRSIFSAIEARPV